MTIRWRYYSANLQKICNIVGLRYKEEKLTCSQYLDQQFLLSLNISSFWIYGVTYFPKISRIISPPIRCFRFSAFILETLELEWQCSQYLELNPTCAMTHFFKDLRLHILTNFTQANLKIHIWKLYLILC